jgi:hypothetical protein
MTLTHITFKSTQDSFHQVEAPFSQPIIFPLQSPLEKQSSKTPTKAYYFNPINTQSYWGTRIRLLRFVYFIFVLSFHVSAVTHQNCEGSNPQLPLGMKSLSRTLGTRFIQNRVKLLQELGGD